MNTNNNSVRTPRIRYLRWLRKILVVAAIAMAILALIYPQITGIGYVWVRRIIFAACVVLAIPIVVKVWVDFFARVGGRTVPPTPIEGVPTWLLLLSSAEAAGWRRIFLWFQRNIKK